MKRILVSAVVVAAVGAVFWLMVRSLQTEPSARDRSAAIILRAPDGYAVQDLGVASFESAAGVVRAVGGQTGVRFIEHGDTVILLADRRGDRVVEMRASRTGTIVERQWPGEIDHRLAWAAEHGDLNAPGLPSPTGKNLYH